MFFFGIGFLIIGLSLFFVQRNQKQKLFSIKAARLMTASELSETAGAVAAEIGGGSWRDHVKLWGEITTDAPLFSDHKQAPCVHFVSQVTREYEEKDEDGKLVQKTETVSQNRQSTPFWLSDRTGTIKVDPDGADIETIKIMDEFQAKRSGATRGHRYSESVLPVGREVLVVGAASDLTGDVVIGKPIQSEHKYIISLKNEEMLAASTSRDAKNIFYGMVGCLGLGIILLILGILPQT